MSAVAAEPAGGLRCVCGQRPCLLHYAELAPAERARIRQRLGVVLTSNYRAEKH